MGTSAVGFLDRMADRSRARVEAACRAVPFEQMRGRAQARGPAPALRIGRHGFDLIAEVKLRSPSDGGFEPREVNDRAWVTRQTRAYSDAGAGAISVLTEPTEFAGDLEHVAWAQAETSTPVLRKDFIVDPYQVAEARASGASGVLLIARILEDDEVLALADVARSFGMWVLLECFDEDDIDRSDSLLAALSGGSLGPAAPGVILLGVNCRNLNTLQVEFERLISLAPRLPKNAIAVAESGLTGPTSAQAVARAGYRMALVGSALMRSAEPRELITSMLMAGREEVQCAST